MQVVYSGGSNTPTPSPRLQRKIGYSRPVMPGYMTHVHPQILVQRSREKLTEGDTTLRDSIPAMSTCVASLCLVLNIFVPGSGTLTAGLSVLCCSRVRPRGGTKRHCILLNAGVALMQFFLTFLFLLGWIWSITWGVAFISIARKYQRRDLDEPRHHHRSDEKGQTKSRDKSTPSPHGSPNKRHRTGPHDRDQQEHNSQYHHHHHPHHQNHHYDQQHHHNHHHHHHHQHQQQPPHHQQHHHHSHNHQLQTPPSPRCKGDVSPNNRSGNSPQLSFPREASSTNSSPGAHRMQRDPNLETVASTSRQTQQHPRHSPSPGAGDKEQTTASALPQPIIVLQKAPEICKQDGAEENVSTAPGKAIMQARTRHMKMLQRKMSDNDLSPFVLTNQQLEAIVIHDLPVSTPSSYRNSNAVIEESVETLPKI